jgi:hypothetical protein
MFPSLVLERRNDPPPPGAYAQDTWTSGFDLTGLSLVAMVVSDAGLTSTEPTWWNASPLGCFLISLQPRGGWQILQRSVQWGRGPLSRCFGVECPPPILYAYFACSIRNRIEVWDSPRFKSPMEGQTSTTWQTFPNFEVSRPSKLLDGSRGGAAFMCSLLIPQGDHHYSIDEQARMQYLSILLAAAGLVNEENRDDLDAVFREDFEISNRVGTVFTRLFRGLILASFLTACLLVSSSYATWKSNIYGASAPYILQLTSYAAWTVGSIGLLMMGGNPQVTIDTKRALPDFIEERIRSLETPLASSEDINEIPEDTEEIPKDVRLEFGSLHGSAYTQDKGFCLLPAHVVRAVCKWQALRVEKTTTWYLGFGWYGLLLLCSVATQVAGSKITTLGSEIMFLGILMITALLRGAGLAGKEEWMIPLWTRRRNASYGAILMGHFVSRAGKDR